uniref:Uncharacterized protein n=1 Tax=Equus asinus asinus TaxID=83772 RepID=A0A8C4MSB6_EQUAS
MGLCSIFGSNKNLIFLDISQSFLSTSSTLAIANNQESWVLTILPLVWCFCRLENCHLTEASCKELSSALIVNQRLTHLCLAKNALGDGGCPTCHN